MKSANDALRFVVEMSVLVSLGYWGLHATDSGLRWPLMIAAPAAVTNGDRTTRRGLSRHDHSHMRQVK